MTLSRMFAVASVFALAGCAGAEGDPHRFESWADALSAVPMSVDAPQTAEQSGLRGPVEDRPREDMRVEVVNTDLLWEARAVGFDEALRGPVENAVSEVATHAAQAAVAEVASQVPVVRASAPSRPAQGGLTVQLGAFSSQAAAEAAWSRLEAHGGLAAAQPSYEAVERGGRTLTRLRAGPVAAEVVSDVCRAAGAGDWCASTARS